MSTWLARKLGKLSERGVVGTVLDTAFTSAKETSAMVSKPFFDWIVKQVTDANGIMDLQSGSLKSGATTFVEGLLKTLGEVLSDTTIPQVDMIFSDSDNDPPKETYLSYELTLNLLGGLKKIKDALGTIPTAFGSYKSQSLEFVKYFFDVVEEYSKLFSIFAKDKRFIFFNIAPPSYDKLLNIRKEMKDCLAKMKRYLDKYIEYGYTFKNMKEKFEKIELGIDEGVKAENIKKALALAMFWEASKCIFDYSDYIQGLKIPSGKEIYDVVSADSKLKKKIQDKLINALQLTDQFSLDELRGIINGMKCDEFVKTYAESNPVPWHTHPGVGWKQCCSLADEEVRNDKLQSISAQKMRISYPLLGDYALKLKECVEYTLNHLNEVINLGVKASNLGTSGVEADVEGAKGGVVFNLEKLLGGYFRPDDSRKLRERERKLMQRVKSKAEMTDRAFDLYEKCKKAYDKAQKDGLRDGDFVNLPSSSDGRGEKGYKLSEHWTEIDTTNSKIIEEEVKRKTEPGFESNEDYPLLLQRKSKKFLRAVEQWYKELKERKKSKKDDDKTFKNVAQQQIKKVAEHYKDIMKNNKDNKEMQKIIKEAYKKIPSNASKFVREMERNSNNVKAFCSGNFDSVK